MAARHGWCRGFVEYIQVHETKGYSLATVTIQLPRKPEKERTRNRLKGTFEVIDSLPLICIWVLKYLETVKTQGRRTNIFSLTDPEAPALYRDIIPAPCNLSDIYSVQWPDSPPPVSPLKTLDTNNPRILHAYYHVDSEVGSKRGL